MSPVPSLNARVEKMRGNCTKCGLLMNVYGDYVGVSQIGNEYMLPQCRP